MGRLSEAKGINEVLEVFRRLNELGIDVELRLAGLATETIAERVRALQENEPDRIRWYGELSGEAKDQFYRSLDLFLLPTRYKNEAEPLVVLEATAAGVPTAAYTRGCIGELVREGGLGVPPDASYVDLVVPYVLDLIRDPERRCRIRFLLVDDLAKRRAKGRKQLSQLLDLTASL